MVNRLIKNEEDYDMALSRIEQLMDAKSGTAEMDELELLTALVEMYEERYFPISPPDPIDAIKFSHGAVRIRPERHGSFHRD
jgi:HTH-type transcriptional regulator / antitoxin HigA